ncbi:hypothetical protein N7495_002473 [Penicillium taxi]|uniref:uncharacterized protein n=1 Tax=Penicillium taxi TaxID=168475 RepID=UPI0025450A6B|nr:uncharacterized protein N7495_002473 [Penicillium taxi]KAJ5901945.1 hypothetical protein N7495_002473 [Penicillium taxi]
MPSLARRQGVSQEALLRLEKGSEAPSTQLHEAAQIIGLDLALCESHPETHRVAQIQQKSTPKEEWVLRWLLKRLRTGKNYRVNPASFLLLRQLIDLISPKNLAAILKDQKFLSILCDTAADLVENGLSISSFESDSGHAFSVSPHQDEHQGTFGTKRKRASAEANVDAMDLDQAPPPNPASCFLTFVRVLDCVYGVVALDRLTLGTDEVAKSHLKLALRGEPEVISQLLGSTFQLAAVAVTQFSQAIKTTDLQHLMYVFPAILELWEARSYRQDDTDNKASNDCFSKSCFAHALRLQLCVRAINLDTDERADLLHAVERIITLHVILPARATFLESGGSGIDYSKDEPNWNAVQPVTDWFRPIIREKSSILTSEEPKHQSFKSSWRSIELLPELFDTAVRAVPRDEFRRQIREAPWLETLFVAVAELAYSTAEEDDPLNYSSHFVTVLEKLLRVALNRNVGLSLHTILAHARYTGLLKKGLQDVEWTVTALVISLGVDVFLPNSGLRDTRKLLDALLEKIMLQWKTFHSQNNKTYSIVKNDVVLPLLRGFAAARDMATFVEVWHGQLIALEEERLKNPSHPFFSVWEDDDLCETYCEVLRTSFNAPNFAKQIQNAATETRDNGKIAVTPQSYANFVIIEASFRGRALVFAESETTLTTILETITTTLSSKQTFHWRWRVWRFLQNLRQNQLHTGDTVLIQKIGSFIDAAAKNIHRNHKKLTESSVAPLESWEAYQFALVLVNGKPSDEQVETFGKISKDVTKLIVSASPDIALQSMKAPWNGRIDTLDSPAILALAYILILFRSPKAWPRVTPESRSDLLQQLLSLATVQYRSSPTALEAVSDDAQFLEAWASVVCHDYLLKVPLLVSEISLILKNRIEDDSSNRRLYVESLNRIPATLITRGLRTSILDTLQNVLVEQDSDAELTVGVLTMMAKLASMPKSDATVTSSWEPIWTAARSISLQGTDMDLQIMKAFRTLHCSVIAKLLLSKDDRDESFKKLFARLSRQASKLRQIDRDSMACFLLRLSMMELWAHRKELAKAFSEEELATCRERVFGLVLADIKSVKEQCKKHKPEETITLIKTIDALEDFEDLATNNIEVVKFLGKIESYMEMSVDSAPSRLIRRRLVASKPEKSSTKPVLKYLETLTLPSLYAEDQQLFIQATTELFKDMSADKLVRTIRDLRELGLTGNDAAQRTLVIYLAITALSPVEDKESPATRELSLVCTELAEAIVRSTRIDEFSFATECLYHLLRVHSRSLAQCNIDTILAATALAASKAGPQLSPEYAPTIFTRLCRLAGLVFGLQRVKIGGRHHLVVTVMKRLLNCLFVPSRKRSRAARATASLSSPFWIGPLDASHTSSYTRLLTTLSDPTVSAVIRSQSNQSRGALIDETKRAKRIAGQYLQNIIMHYAQNSLRASLSPEVKAALMPGLYAAMDVMTRESLRALNAALDISGRAVFKSLYDDYVRFGKWNKA